MAFHIFESKSPFEAIASKYNQFKQVSLLIKVCGFQLILVNWTIWILTLESKRY